MKKLLSRLFKLAVSGLMILVMCPAAVTTAEAEGTEVSGILDQLITNITVSKDGTELSQPYSVLPNTSYKLTLSFAETNDVQFDDVNVMTYKLPDGVSVADITDQTASITVQKYDTATKQMTDYYIVGNTYSIQNGVLRFQFNQADANYTLLTAAANATFNVDMSAEFTKTIAQKAFGNNVNVAVTLQDVKPDLTISKTVTYDSVNKEFDYTVNVTSTGTNNNIVVTDTIDGDLLKYQGDADTDGHVGTAVTNGNGFTYTIPTMTNGQQAAIHYTAKITDVTKLTANGDIDQTKDPNGSFHNLASVTSNETKDKKQAETWKPDKFKLASLNKEETSNTVGTDGKNYINWKITYKNQGMVGTDAMRTITDTIDDPTDMQYTGNYTVKYFDAKGNQIGDTETYALPTDQSTFSYVAKQVSTAKIVEIDYQTTVDMRGRYTSLNVSNTVKDGWGNSKDASTEVGPDQSKVIDIQKTAETATQTEITWKITLTVPAAGVDQAEVVDHLPYTSIDGKNWFDDYKDGSAVIKEGDTTLVEGTDYTIATGTYNGAYKDVVIDFMHDGKNGFASSTADRTIVIELTTLNNETWLKKAATNSNYNWHGNRAIVNDNKYADAWAEPPYTIDQAISKQYNVYGAGTDSATNMPYLPYTIDVSGLNQSTTEITDSFDTSVFEVKNVWVEYWDCHWNGYNSYNVSTDAAAAGITATTDAVNKKVTFQLTRNTDSQVRARIHYNLEVKDEEQLKKVAQPALADNGTYAISNTAYYGDLHSATNYEYTYPALTKTLTNENEVVNGNSKTAHFEIDVNPNAVDMSAASGEALVNNMLELEDTVSNLSINASTIKVTDGVTYTPNGNTLTFHIPNSTHVHISYDATVIGEAGTTSKISNTAKLYGVVSTVSDDAKIKYNAGGDASVYELSIKKYSGTTSNGLQGVTFLLWDGETNSPVMTYSKNSDGTYVYNTDGSHKTQQYSVTTDANGDAEVFGSKHDDGWALENDHLYYLTESNAPVGYQSDSEHHYEFTITNSNVDNQTRYIVGSTMYIENKPVTTAITVTKDWVDNTNASESRPDEVVFKILKSTDNKNWTDTGRTVTLSEAEEGKTTNEWTADVNDLPQYENGTKLSYKAEEQNVSDKYQAVSSTDGLTITNTRIVGDLQIKKSFAGDTITDDDKANLKFEITKPDGTKETVLYSQFTDGVYTMNNVAVGTYTVHEVNPAIEGYDVTVTTKVNGKDSANDSSAAVSANQQTTYEITDNYTELGNLVIKKSFAGDTITDDDKANLKFEITKPDGTTETVLYSQFTDGAYTLNNVPVGTYKVHEVNPTVAGYDVTVTTKVNDNNAENDSDASVTKGETTTYEITDTYSQLGGLILKKSFAGDTITDDDKANLKFEITKPDGTTETVLYSQFKDGTYALNNAPAGTYKIHEVNPTIEGYDVTVTTKVNNTDAKNDSDAAVTKGGTTTYEITDNYTQLGNLVIKKSFAGDTITDDDKANLKFEITKPDGTTETVLYSQFTDGSYTLNNVPAGTYTVHEVNPTIAGYDVTVTTKVNNTDVKNDSDAAVTKGGTTNYEITDNYTQLGNLVIKKSFAGDTITDDDKANLKFEITKPDGTTETVLFSQFTDGSYTLNNVPAGTYTVHEVNPTIAGYDVTVTTKVNNTDVKNDSDAAVTKGGTTTYEITDTYSQLGGLILKKSFAGDTITDDDKANLKFEITKPDGTTETVLYSQFKDGTYALNNAPAGTYKIHEVNPTIAGYDVTVTTKVDNEDVKNDSNATVTNGKTTTYEITDEYSQLGNLVIKKTLAGDTINDNDRDNLKFEITKPDGTTETVLYGQFTNGIYTLNNVPTGTYTVHEVNPTIEGYDVTVTTKVNDKNSDNDVKVAVTKGGTTNYEITDNYTKLGTLVIKKTLAGDTINDNDRDNLKFEITKPDGTTETVLYSQFTDGVYSLGYVPAGTYTVHEVNPTIAGYDVTVTTKVNDVDAKNDSNAAVTKGGTTTYEITDNYTQLGNLVIKKTLAGDTINDNDRDNLKFEITKPDGTTETVLYSQFTDGSYTLNNVPAGTYTVHEVNPTIEGYDVTVTTKVNDTDAKNDSDAAVTKGGTTTYEITDDYTKLGTLVIKKSFDGENIDQNDKDNLKFEITKPDGTTETVQYSQFTDGVYSLGYVPAGTYKVHEVNPTIEGYDVTVTTQVNDKDMENDVDASVVKGETTTYAIKDSYKKPTLPSTPDNPTTPERPTTPSTNNRPKTPNTGDQTNAPLAAGVMGLSMLIAGFAIFFKKKYSA